MKKRIYTIGREPQCDIWLQDSTDVASRNHAILEVGNGGKYFLTDQSRNGTYVNGIKMTPGAKVPVSRRDVISFAHVQELDWSVIPKDNAKKFVIIGAVLAVVIAAVVLAVCLAGNKSTKESSTENIATLNLYTDDSGIIGNSDNDFPTQPQEEEAVVEDTTQAKEPTEKTDSVKQNATVSASSKKTTTTKNTTPQESKKVDAIY